MAAQRPDVAAVIALTPLVDGRAAAVLALRHRTVSSVVRNLVAGVQSPFSTARRAEPVRIPIVAEPGGEAAINLDGAYQRYTALAGLSWCNEIDATIGFELLRYRPNRFAADIRCRALIQIGDGDRSAPPHAAAAAAAKAGTTVRHYDGDHFDFWPGGVYSTR